MAGPQAHVRAAIKHAEVAEAAETAEDVRFEEMLKTLQESHVQSRDDDAHELGDISLRESEDETLTTTDEPVSLAGAQQLSNARLDLQREEMVMEFFADKEPKVEFMTRAAISQYIKTVLEKNKAFHAERVQRHNKGGRKELLLHARDLRKLDLAVSEDADPFIIVRRHVVLLRLVPIRAIILRDRCLLLVPDGADEFLATIRARLQEPLDDITKFEFRALEAILEAKCLALQRVYRKLTPRTLAAMRALKVTTSRALESMRRVKNDMDKLQANVIAMQRTLSELLDDDDDLFLLNLTRLWEDPSLFDLPKSEKDAICDEIEILLESYVMNINQTLNDVTLMQQRMKNTESLMNIKLDSARNSLLSLSVMFTVVSMCIAGGGLVPGIFGMNLTSNWEEEQGVFAAVVLNVVFGVILAIIAILAYLFYRGVLIF
eukprot:m.142823 g.142823  ORF g.142823 m.142823 type:complete len:433 (+) comp9654_c1_seq3:3747-5045(+)